MAKFLRFGLEIQVANAAMPHYPGIEKAGTSVQDLNPTTAGLSHLSVSLKTCLYPKIASCVVLSNVW